MAEARLAMVHQSQWPLDATFPAPRLIETWGDRDVDTLAVEDEGWNLLCPEDYALEPILDWTDEHRDLLLAAHRRHWAHVIDDGGWVETTWPPSGSLSTGGYPTFDDAAPARWEWRVTVTVWGVDDDGREDEVDRDDSAFLITLVDPRDVEYSGFGPLR